MKLTIKLNNINILFLLKTGIGSAAAILLADSLGISYSPSAGIITLLTIQNTKKETIFIAIKRFAAFLLALVITYCVFQSIGYHAWAFGLIIFLFVAICMLSGLKDGISMNAVLMTHFLIERKMNLQLIFNEVLLLMIGMGIGIIINLIMPRYRERIRREQISLEEEFKKILQNMSVLLIEKDACLIQEDSEYKNTHELQENRTTSELQNISADFVQLEISLDNLLKRAYEEAGNTLLNNTKYRIIYLEMRKLQIGVLKIL